MNGKIFISIYGFGVTVFFIALNAITYIGQIGEKNIASGIIIERIMPFIVVVNSLIILFIYLTRDEGRFQWRPLYVGNKLLRNVCSICFWIFFVYLAISVLLLFLNQSEQMSEIMAIRTSFCIMAYMSWLIVISFTVGLDNVVPRFFRRFF